MTPITGARRATSCCAWRVNWKPCSRMAAASPWRRDRVTRSPTAPLRIARALAPGQSSMSSTDDYEISTDPSRLDIAAMHAYLARSYWSPGIPYALVERAAQHSLCFGLYEKSTGRQVGLTRVVTDHATFAYLCDVYVLEEHR